MASENEGVEAEEQVTTPEENEPKAGTASENGESMRGHEVFISYSTKNKNVADAIVANFEQNGIRCWYAPRDILPGQEWVSAIKEALHVAKIFVLIYTDESNSSRQVMNEVALAFNAGKTIVPFRLTEEVMNDELEYYLTRVHWLDAVSKPLERNIDALRNYVEVILQRPKAGEQTKTEQSTAEGAEKKAAGKSKKAAGQKKSKAGLWIALAAAAVLLIGLGVFALMKFSGPKTAELMEAGKQAFYYGKRGTEDARIARENFQKAADKGEAEAYYYLGMLEEWEYDFKEAKDFYEKGSDAGNDHSKLRLGYLYQKGYGVKADFDKAWKLYKEVADNGCVDADYFRAKVVATGIAGQEFDTAKALKYYQNVVSESQDPYYVAAAYNEIGHLYRKGSKNVPADYDKALENYEKITETMNTCLLQSWQENNEALTYKAMGEDVKAEEHYLLAYDANKEMADAGGIVGMIQCGYACQYGRGVSKDLDAAKTWYNTAKDAVKAVNSKGCCFEALYYLGVMAEKDDYNVAYEYYKEAASAGYGSAAGAIGDLYYYGRIGRDDEGNENMDLARQWYDKAIECGNVNSYCNVGNIYYDGTKKIEANQEEGMSWYMKGAAAGSTACMYNIGWAYEQKEEYEKAFEWYEKASEMEYVKAYVVVGDFYGNGLGVAQDLAKAGEWYLKAAREDNDNGMYKYGKLILYGGEGVEKNEEEGIAWLTKAVDRENTNGMAALGDYYYEKEDYDNAFLQYKALADANYNNAVLFYRLGKMYLDGLGTAKNEESAILWLTKASEMGNEKANKELATGYYDNGDYVKAFPLYKSLVDNGSDDQDALCRLGRMYLQELGTAKNEKEGIRLLNLAAGKGDLMADSYLGDYYYNNGDYAKSFPFYKAMADGNWNNKTLFRRLGYLYKIGEGTEKDYLNALIWYEKAYAAGATLDNDELLFVGARYYKGDPEGVEKNWGKAFPYYKAAAEADNTDAMVFLGQFYYQGIDGVVQQDFNLALQWLGKALDKGNATEGNQKYCRDVIKKMVNDGQVTKEAAGKWLK